ncbi:chitin synthase chs-2 [Oreochromis niloticus]|uniref:chitin synthase chs-2 n=1 Tax=Oreochromis niloticus TaxID=8128 RepID=UPI000904C648|nr:chitin synthase chs-2 [Oreochromis niloticus]
MEEQRDLPKRPWDICQEVPIIEDEQTPWKMIKLLKIISLFAVAVIVFGSALCSKTSFLLLITLSNEGTKTLPPEQKPVALLCIGCSLIASSVFLFLKSIWKYDETSKLPRKTTSALVLFFEFLVSAGASILTIVAMPHLDIVTNVTIFNGVAVISAILQLVAQCSAKQRNRFLMPCIFGFIFILIGYVLFLLLYITKNPSDIKMAIWVGLAVGGSILVSFNSWESYLKKTISDNSSFTFLKNLCSDIEECQNILYILSSLIRIVVTACVIGAYVPLAKMDWSILTSIPSRETKIIAIIIGVQLFSSTLCHWFALAACKMHALRRCFILPLYLASLAVMALLVIPVTVYYQDYRTSLNGTANINFTDYCKVAVDGRNQSLNDTVFQHLVLDVTHTLCFLDMSKIADICILTGSAVFWWIGFVLVTLYLWKLNVHRIERTQDLLIRRLYEGAFIEQSLLLNTRFDIQTKERIQKDVEQVKVYLCATMWHETYEEMMSIIISIFRLDEYRPKEDPKSNDFTFKAHIYFDDAFEAVGGSRHLNKYAKDLVKVIKEVFGIFKNIDQKLFKKQQQVPDQKIIQTPYGGRLIVNMPQGNKIVVHFKDKELIRHKKRWSQIMYLYYLLGWKLTRKFYTRWQKGEDEQKLKEQAQKKKHNTYILALDGDTDFQPASVMLLIDRLRIYPHVGAACGRIHPTGSGPVVWFQKFEYAVSHWLQKTAEHVIGCVLCSPGCFSLFRAEALMDDNVMKTYSTESKEPSHYIQYDQGEDRWLCTLLLKQGWRVEYNAASDAYTNAPMDFKELYNQRRRWGPSTMANVVDLLGSTKIITKRNQSISKAFMFYQLFGMISSIMGPSTICLLVSGSLTFVLNINSAAALVISVIPPAIYLGLCFRLKSDTQIIIAAILSVCYAFLMLTVAISIIGSMLKEKTILTPSSIFIIFMAIIYLITAAMHPQEFNLVFYGFLYIICVPSAYLLLTIYSMVNMNDVSWGTRETKPAAGAAPPPALTPQTRAQKAKSICQWFISWVKCCKKSSQRFQGEQLSRSQDNTAQEPEQLEPEAQNTIVEDITITEEEQGYVLKLDNNIQTGWIEMLQSLYSDMKLQEGSLDQEEKEFWEELQKEYLEPLPDDKEKQKKMDNELRELRNKINFSFFILNAFWLVATFIFQIFNSTFAICIPKLNLQLQETGDIIQIEPIAFMFILGFAVTVVIQFLAMLYHRIQTLIDYVAFVDTEPKERKKTGSQKSYLPGKRDEFSSNADSSYRSMEDLETNDRDIESQEDLMNRRDCSAL